MNATINAPCEHGWPARECDRHDDVEPRRPLSFVIVWAVLGGATAAFWGCIWLGLVEPLIEAWRGR